MKHPRGHESAEEDVGLHLARIRHVDVNRAQRDKRHEILDVVKMHSADSLDNLIVVVDFFAPERFDVLVRGENLPRHAVVDGEGRIEDELRAEDAYAEGEAPKDGVVHAHRGRHDVDVVARRFRGRRRDVVEGRVEALRDDAEDGFAA